MRNIFDQYSQPENRLTHALVTCLNEDRALLQRFVRWVCRRKIHGRRAKLFEQSLPGDRLDLSEDESERRGLPDACILDTDEWLLLIETKFQAGVTSDQIRRHIRTASRRGFPNCQVLLIIVKPVRQPVPKGVTVKRWTDIYEWLQRQSERSQWAIKCHKYLEVAESREAANEYLQEGTLTTFSGIPFGPDEPYTYLQAKRVLGLLREELVHDRRLQRQLAADPENPGRGAITGRNADIVWDFIGLRHARSGKVFTQYPHLTLGINRDRLEVYVTIPNGIRSRLRRRLLGDDYTQFERLIVGVTKSLIGVVQGVPGSVPTIVLVQRHYPSQRAEPIHDCWLRFDPRTAVPSRTVWGKNIRHQSQWLVATYDALRNKRSNLQFQIGVDFPYNECQAVRKRTILKAAVDTWLACRPIIKAARES